MKVSTQLVQIAKKAKLDYKVRFTSLAHLLTPEFLKETWGTINRRGAAGVVIRCDQHPGVPEWSENVIRRNVDSLM